MPLTLRPLLALPLLAACSSPAEKAAPAPAAAQTPAAPASTVSAAPDTTAVLTDLLKPRFPQLRISQFKAGDINADGRPDLIVVAGQPCEAEDGMEGAQCRTVLLVVNEGFPKLRVAAANENIVDCSTCGGAGVGDPHQGIVVKGNYFTFESLYGACDKTAGYITFRYDKASNNWFLHRLSSADYSCNDTDSVDAPVRETQRTRKDFGRVSFADYAEQVI